MRAKKQQWSMECDEQPDVLYKRGSILGSSLVFRLGRYDSVGGVQGYGTITKEVPAPLTLSPTDMVKEWFTRAGSLPGITRRTAYAVGVDYYESIACRARTDNS